MNIKNNKMTGEQILEKLEEVFGNNISAFAHCDYTEADVEGFKYDEEKAKSIGKEKQEFWKSIEDTLPSNYEERKTHPNKIIYDSMPSKWGEMQRQLLEYLGLGEIKEVEQHGGEDQGSDWYSIKHFVDHDVYIKTSGWYASHHGTDFEEGIGEIVKPVKKTITVFE